MTKLIKSVREKYSNTNVWFYTTVLANEPHSSCNLDLYGYAIVSIGTPHLHGLVYQKQQDNLKKLMLPRYEKAYLMIWWHFFAGRCVYGRSLQCQSSFYCDVFGHEAGLHTLCIIPEENNLQGYHTWREFREVNWANLHVFGLREETGNTLNLGHPGDRTLDLSCCKNI